MKIIDSHLHLDLYDNNNVPSAERVLKLKKEMKSANVEKVIILQDIQAVSKVLSGDEIFKLIQNEKFLFFAPTIEIEKCKKSDLEKFEKLFEKEKAVAVKLYPGYESFYPNDDRCKQIYDLCEKHNKPVIFHEGDTLNGKASVRYAHPLFIDDLAVARPDLKIVIAHLGNPWMKETALILANRSNVYADLSGLIYGGFDQKLIAYLRDDINRLIAWCDGSGKLLFGTDWPYNSENVSGGLMNGYINFIQSLDLNAEDLEKIFYNNAEKLFFK